MRVMGRPVLGQTDREILMAVEVFWPLPHTVIARLLTRAVAGPNWLAAEIQDVAVLMSDDWVVSIYGEKLIDCVSAMCVLINSISRELDSAVAIELLTPVRKNDHPLYRQIERESKKSRAIAVVKWGLTIAASAIAGAFLQWLIGGDLLR